MGETRRVRDTNMTGEDLALLVARGYELRGVEFKGPGKRTDKHYRARVAKAVLGLSNNRDGGMIILGVEDPGDSLRPVGLPSADLKTWNYDDVVSAMSAYADPPAEFDIERVEMENKIFVVIRVHEFDDVPILCKTDYSTPDGSPVLQRGSCYVRSRGRRETTRIPTQAEMRELLEIATEKRLRAYVAVATRAGVRLVPAAERSDRDIFDEELGDLK